MLPKDPVMLLSFVNTQLRDKCKNIDDFCVQYNISQEDVISKLEKIGYSYSLENNKFQ